MDIKEWLIDWFVSKTSRSKQDIVTIVSENYLESGLIDSFSFVMLLSDIDDEYGITFSNEDFINPLFPTIDGLAQLIEERK